MWRPGSFVLDASISNLYFTCSLFIAAKDVLLFCGWEVLLLASVMTSLPSHQGQYKINL